VLPQDWSQDGRFILYGSVDPQKTGRDIWMLDLADPEKRRVLANTTSEERVSQFSPDGRWIAYETNASGRFEIVVQALAEGGELHPVSRAGGTQARWRADSREIYFVAPGGMLMAARVTAVPGKTSGGVEIGTPVPLFPTQLAEGGPAIYKAQYVVTRDGRFLIAQPRETLTLPLTLLQNWTPAVQRD
jgi:dipeptidyl aminopeptidase/acylaminoacyl peptidase